MAQSPFPAEGSPPTAPTQPRSLGEYRQELLKALSGLENDDLGILLTCYFPELDFVQDATKNRMSILRAPLLVSEIWSRVNTFLLDHTRPQLGGEPPPVDLGNRSGRTSLGDLQSHIATPSASWPVVSSISSEITWPATMAQVTAAAVTAAVTAAEPAGVRPPVPARPRLLLGGFFVMVALLAVHLCPFVRHTLVTPKRDLLESPENALLAHQRAPRIVFIPVALEQPHHRGSRSHPRAAQSDKPLRVSHHHTRHHGARSAAAEESLDGQVSRHNWPTMCSFTDPRHLPGDQRPAQIQRQIPLPADLQPGSPAARSWAHAACIRARREILRGK